ncbi:formate dehydrogenase accessory protein FdhE [Desulfovibrio mangrovi]|uniref:formate dehydrogenase accessory protein FdhE n=1 Tax=Desulfovibrio mangrovi TaxID=2976983 RepID=UPI002247F623|nr:formate dehydrogenase accessory protein FdhE [Desulfovibrio mangrovi]UZP67744.1 formate dehydrogenase accessory protein FdhE [Desulfovibrio mangrovi]
MTKDTALSSVSSDPAVDPFAGSKRSGAAETLSAACVRRPALASVLSPFIPLFAAKEEVCEELKAGLNPVPELMHPDVARLEGGVALLASVSLDWLVAPFKQAASRLLPHLASLPALAGHVTRYLEALESGSIDAAAISQACLASDAAGLERMAQAVQMPAPVLVFLTHQALGTVLRAAREISAPVVPSVQWREGYCPVCGSFPSLGCLGRPDPDQSEFVKGGGGHKYLHCSLCGNDWRYRRGACPACSNEDPGAIEYMRAKESPWERVELCRKCNTYVAALDLRETVDSPDLDAAAIGLMHLDLLAASEGLRPLAPSLWNSFD